MMANIGAEIEPSFGNMLLEAIAKHGERVAIIDKSERLTYPELGNRIADALERFRALGLSPGDTIAQLSGNSISLYATMAAAYIGGFRSITLHAMGGVDDHRYILDDSGAKLFICDAVHAKRAEELASNNWQGTILRSHGENLVFPDFWAGKNAGVARLPQHAAARPEDIIRLAYTGGTTGKPKGVMLSDRAMAANLRMALAGIDWPDNTLYLCPAPISHGGGSIVAPTLVRGGTVILQDRFSTEQFLADLSRYRATVTWLVPTMVQALLDEPRLEQSDRSSLETLIYSGAPMSPARIREALDKLGPILFQCYGQTEAPNTILRLTRADHKDCDEYRLSSAGKPFPGIEVSILRDDGQPAGPEEAGEICVRGNLLMSGYWNKQEATAGALQDGWLRTGDIALIDPTGYYHIVDRKKDMVITGGFNVYPKEIEDVLATHPAVQAAAVIGVPDSKWGEAVHALVVLRDGRSATEADLQDCVRSAKGSVHTPKSIEFVESLPLTALGKPDKQALRSRHAKLSSTGGISTD